MIHQYKQGGYNIVLDVCSGSVHVVDEVAYDIIALFEKNTKKYILDTIEQKYQDRSDITKEDIEDICFFNLERYDLRKKAFLSMRGIIKSTLEFAYRKKWSDENAYHRVNFKEFDDMLIAETPIEIRAHSDAEVDAILAELHQKQTS